MTKLLLAIAGGILFYLAALWIARRFGMPALVAAVVAGSAIAYLVG